MMFPPEHKEFQKVVTDYQFINMEEGYNNINVTPFCVPEVQCCITAGPYYLVGVLAEAIAGDSITAKFAKVHQMTWEALLELVHRSGFAVKVDNEDVIAIPAGFIIITHVRKGAEPTSLRWGVMSGSAYPRAHAILTDMLQSFPYLKNTDYNLMGGLMEANKT